MRGIWFPLVVCAIGAVLTLGSAIALATGGDARGGHAVSVTPKAPLLPKQKRGWIGAKGEPVPVDPGLATPFTR
jgi:hypothetical protein